MINIKEISLILDSIPKLLQYYIPGYWAIFIFGFFSSKRISNNIIHILSCSISYIFISFIAVARAKINSPVIAVPDTALINSSLALLSGTILALIAAKLFTSQKFSGFIVKMFHKTPNDYIWRDVLDLENGSNLKIYLKNEEYYIIGHHKNHEEKDGDCWLAISAFGKFDKNTNSKYKEEPSYLDNQNVIYTVRFSDIEHIEIFN